MEEFGGVLEYMWGVNGRHDKNNKAERRGLPAANQTRRGRFCKELLPRIEKRPEGLWSNHLFSLSNTEELDTYISARRG